MAAHAAGPWVFIVVYGSFTIIAASFAVVIGEDRARERTATIRRGAGP